jgi:hypothetical protein
MSFYQWKTFHFFEKTLVKEEESNNENKENVKKPDICCVTSGRGFIVVGDVAGGIRFFDRDFKVTLAFQAYTRTISLMEQIKQKNLLVTVGEDEEATSPILKIWDLDHIDEEGYPEMIRSHKLSKFPATSMACLADMNYIAVGLCDGTVVVLSGDIGRERSSKIRTLQPEVNRTPVNPITALGFCEQKKGVALFVATTSGVYCYTITKDTISQPLQLEDKGCEVGVATVNDENEFVVGRNEAIYFYNTTDRGPCLAFEGVRKLLTWFRNYLVAVEQTSAGPKFHNVVIYERKIKFIAFLGSFQNVTHVVSEWGSLFVFQQDGKIFQLTEKDTQTKLETLFKKHLYSTAIELAHSSQYDANAIVDIFRKYGDHLYSKGDYDLAITQYIKTIGRLEPSYVIKKFLDAQRIHNLTLYLQKLHEAGLANANHTTLLLNCYTKLKDLDKLNEFIKKPDLKFDVETAIKVCRSAGYHQHALDLALRHQEHKWLLKILLEDLHQYEQALKYIETLPFEEAQTHLQKYGKILVTELPQPTTKLLMELCTSYVPKKPPAVSEPTKESKTNPSASVPTDDKRSLLLSQPTNIKTETPKENRANPEEFIHLFVSQPLWLIEFLEFVVQNGRGTPLIFNTLLELYLKENRGELTNTSQGKITTKQPQERSEKIMALLMNPQAKYDEGHALVLCQMHNFKAGILYLYEKMKLYAEIVHYYMEQNDSEQIIKACKKFGDKDPNIWIKALSYFANKDPKEECKAEISEVLMNIERDNLLPPMQVIQILAQSKTATLGLIKEYITKHLEREQRLIEEDQRLIRQYNEETERNKKEIEELRTGARIFQQLKCTNCGLALDLPAVHFLCMHSFHQRCLDENENVCPRCAEEHRNFEQRQLALEENAQDHSEFFRQLEQSPDGFSIVARYFGRGIFNPPTNVPKKEPLQNLDPQLLRLDPKDLKL